MKRMKTEPTKSLRIDVRKQVIKHKKMNKNL